MSENSESDVLYVPGMARKLGKTESALRMLVARGSDAVPKPFKLGGKLAWRRVDVDRWLAKRAKEVA